MTDTTLDPGEHLHVRQTGFRLAPSPLTLDDPKGQKSRSNFLTSNVKNGNSYDVAPIGFTLADLERLKVKVLSLASETKCICYDRGAFSMYFTYFAFICSSNWCFSE